MGYRVDRSPADRPLASACSYQSTSWRTIAVLSVLPCVLALGATALIASGCGSSKTNTVASTATTTSTNTEPTPPSVVVAAGRPLTRGQWLKRGDAICARLNSWLATNPVKSAADFAVVLPQAAAYERAEFESLVKLVPPTNHRRDWQEFLRDTQQWAANSEALGRTAQAEGAQFDINVPIARTTKDLHEQLAHIAKREGFKECSLV